MCLCLCAVVRQLRPTVASELLGDVDRRLPLPGGLGLAEELAPPPPPPPPTPADRRRPQRNDTAAELIHDRHLAVSDGTQRGMGPAPGGL